LVNARNAIRNQNHDLGIVLVDAGCVSSSVADVDELLVVTTSQIQAITQAYAIIKGWHRLASQVPISLIVNRARHAPEAQAVFDRIAQVCRGFIGTRLRNAGYVLEDRWLVSRPGRPSAINDSSNSSADLCFKARARKIESEGVGSQSISFFRRPKADSQR
jgi:MinD-like ATPase involved in chromosome partitioning or flagellar assembly